jgi:hypothetical protein
LLVVVCGTKYLIKAIIASSAVANFCGGGVTGRLAGARNGRLIMFAIVPRSEHHFADFKGRLANIVLPRVRSGAAAAPAKAFHSVQRRTEKERRFPSY